MTYLAATAIALKNLNSPLPRPYILTKFEPDTY